MTPDRDNSTVRESSSVCRKVAKVPLSENLISPNRGTATGSGKDLPNLDVLRATAVISVLVHHILLQQGMVPYGMGVGGFGVGLFFVHTALVLMWSLERRPNTLDFYIRRVARIYPLAMTVLLVVVTTHAPVSSFSAAGPYFLYQVPTVKQVLTHLFLVQNLFSGNFILYVMWSLPIEVQMYVLLPPLFFFLRVNRSLWPLILFWILAVAFAWNRFGPQEMNLISAAGYFLCGLIAFVGFSRWRPHLPGWLFLVFLAVILYVGGSANNWHLAVFPCLALGLLLPMFHQLRPSPLTRAAWFISRYSYGLYLMHPLSLVLAFYLCANRSHALQWTVLFGSLLLLSVAAYHLIEAPGIRLGSRLARRVAARVVPASAPLEVG
ncbi:MAG TPA: acyltransferase [Acidobacteriaceae bacterium]|nr:acyltransferase [Acidobacteriaceae bacterium]